MAMNGLATAAMAEAAVVFPTGSETLRWICNLRRSIAVFRGRLSEYFTMVLLYRGGSTHEHSEVTHDSTMVRKP